MSNEIILPGEEKPRLAYTVREVADLLSVTKPTIYSLAKKGLPLTKIGANTRILADELRDYLAKQPKVYSKV